jgi:N-acetylneuraminic acid mutarotase
MNLNHHRAWICAATALLLVACSDDPPQPADTGPPVDATKDLPPVGDAGDAGPGDAGPGDAAPADLEPDGPLPTGSWKTVKGTPPLLEHHTATLLASGEVLIAGGYNKNDTAQRKDTSHRYRPTQDDFVAAGKMTTARELHTATLLADGRVLVTGGKSDQGHLESAELFDPAKPAASAWSAVASMNKTRYNHAATRLKDGRVLVTGGFHSSDSTNSVVIYKPQAKSWSTPASMMVVARRYHTSTLLNNGKVLIAGGVNGSSSANTVWLDTMEIYDPASGQFKATKVKMSKKRTGHTATLLKDGRVLIVGGYCGADCGSGQLVDDLYDPVTDSITPVQHAGDLPSSHIAASVRNGRGVLVAGNNDQTYHKDVALFDTYGGGSWNKQPDLAIGRWAATGTRLKDGSVLVVGGVTDNSPYTYADKAERFAL